MLQSESTCPEQEVQTRLLRVSQLIKKLSVSRSTLYAWLSQHSAYCLPTFPKPLRLGDGRSVFWVESEVDAWLHSQRTPQTNHTKTAKHNAPLKGAKK